MYCARLHVPLLRHNWKIGVTTNWTETSVFCLKKIYENHFVWFLNVSCLKFINYDIYCFNYFLIVRTSVCFLAVTVHSQTGCHIDKLSSGYLPGVWVLKADVSEHCVGSIFNRWWSVSEDWLVFSPYLYGKRISWKVVWANQKWRWGRGSGSHVGMGGEYISLYKPLEALNCWYYMETSNTPPQSKEAAI
jgi:hypothetical protein